MARYTGWDPLANLTQENWERVKQIISGENSNRVTIYAARKIIGINKSEFDAWVRRSRERVATDPHWIWEICDVVDDANSMQAQALEDKLWGWAMNGRPEEVWSKGECVGVRTKHDPNLALRLLAARDERYRVTPKSQERGIVIDLDELRAKWKANEMLKEQLRIPSPPPILPEEDAEEDDGP